MDEIKVDSFNELSKLTQVFNEMVAKVWECEKGLKAQVTQLTIEIDTQRKQKQIDR